MKANSLKIKMLAVVTMAAMSLTAFAQALGPVQDSPDGPWYMPGEVLIKFRTNVTDVEIAGAFRGGGLQLIKHVQTAAMRGKGDLGITRAFTHIPVRQVVALLAELPGVEYAQPNWVYRHCEISNDPYYTGGSLWGMYGDATIPANQFGSQAGEAWANRYIGDSEVFVGIIDEGIMYTHPDLAANIWTNPYDPVDGKDNDGNGYVDDVHGWDFFSGDNSVYDGSDDDHATHVAGTIGAIGGNGVGVVGVNWHVTMISAKFLGPNGGLTTDAIEAIDYFIDLKTRHGLNIVALNNSWGGGAYDKALLDAIKRAGAKNILFVAAAGNEGYNIDVTPSYPAAYDDPAVLAVAAIDSAGGLASFSNYGAKQVDLGAPGVGIYSTVPNRQNRATYASYSGTSMATPHVTGAAALYAACNPTATAADIKNAIIGSVTPTSSLLGKTVTGGRLNVSGFAPSAPGAPAAPSGLTATPNYADVKTITLNWTDNSDNETGFEISRNGTVVQDRGADVVSYVDTLTTDGTYTYSVRAYAKLSDGTCVYSSPTTASATLAPPATATLVNVDWTTQGNWLNKYGRDGYRMVTYNSLNTPTYATVSIAAPNIYTWASTTTDPRALLKPDGSSRFAACYHSDSTTKESTSFTITLNVTDENPHRVSLYCLDWDSADRQQNITMFDLNSGAPIPFGTGVYSVDLDNFSGGCYLTWDITGSVKIVVTYKPDATEANAVVSGIFFDDPNYVTPDPPSPPTQLNAEAVSRSQINLSWTDNSNNQAGFKIERSKSATTGFDQIATVGPNTTTFQNTGLAKNTTYYYRVRAYNDGGDSDYSNTASAKTLFR